MLSKADLCFMYRKNEKGICMMSIFVDDTFWVGHEEVLDETIDQIELHFTSEFDLSRMIVWDVNS